MEDSAAEQFSAFCRQIHPQLVGTLTLYCGDREAAHDLAQETLARIWKDWNRLQLSAALHPYTYRAAMNMAKNRFRRLAVRRRYRHLVETDPIQTSWEADSTQAMVVRNAVAGLPANKRMALSLRYFADLSVADTATVMNVPPSTVKSLTRRALADLRSGVPAEFEEDADVQ